MVLTVRFRNLSKIGRYLRFRLGSIAVQPEIDPKFGP